MRPPHRFALLAAAGLLACARPGPRPAAGLPPPAEVEAAGPPVAIPPLPAPLLGPSGQPLAPLPPRPWSEEIVYQVLVDRFADGDGAAFDGLGPAARGAFHGGDLSGLTAHLDEVVSLGVTALALGPVVKQVDTFVTGAGFPEWPYHGGWAEDFTRVDRRFGTEADLAALVEAAHARGLRVLLGFVYNHAGHQAALTTAPATAGFFRRPCGGDDLTACVGNLPDFVTERPAVRDWLLSAQLPWVARLGLDGAWLEGVQHVDHAFWREHRRRLRHHRPEGLFLLGDVGGGDARALEPWFQPDELDAGLDAGFQAATVAWLAGREATLAYARALEARQQVRPGHLLAPFLSSLEAEGALSRLGGDRDRFRLAAALELTVAGLPVILYGDEVARPGGPWPLNRGDMPWGPLAVKPGAGLPRDEALRADYQRLTAARRAHPALTRGAHRTLASAGDLLVFLREDPGSGDAVLVAVNRGAAPATARVERPRGWGAAAPLALLGGAPAGGDGPLLLEVPARGALVLAAPPRAP